MNIMRAIMDEAGLKSKAKSIVFSIPVTDTAGMRLMEEIEEKHALDKLIIHNITIL